MDDYYDRKTCRECGDPIPATKRREGGAFNGRGRVREYCGGACRTRASRRATAARLAALRAARRAAR